jgi:hypothetical protein
VHGLKRRGILQYFTVHRVPECLSLRPNCVPTPSSARECVSVHRVHILIEMKQGECNLPTQLEHISCNFVRDGSYSERGWACIPHPHQPGFFHHNGMYARKRRLPLCVYSVSPPLDPGGGGATLPCGLGGGSGTQFGRLDRKPGTLCTLWSKVL